MTVLIIHGIGGHAGIHWQAWLKQELEALGHTVIMPEMPTPDHPARQAWLQAAQGAVHSVDPSDLIIIGHSLGVTTALDLIETSTTVYGLISVSGFANAYGAELNDYFLQEKVLNVASLHAKIAHAAVLYGDNDPYVAQAALQEIADGLGVVPIIVHDGGHLNTDAGFTEFPQLLKLFKRYFELQR